MAMKNHFSLSRSRVFFNHTTKRQLLSQYYPEYSQAPSVVFPVYVATKGHTIKSIRF